MRPLTKFSPPLTLTENGATWAADYAAAILAGGKKPNVWSRPAIRTRLHEETSERCAYCDVNLLSAALGDIEHIKPREKFPELVVEWENLTLACQRCNSEKSSEWDDSLPFVNPYVDDIDAHFSFFGAFVLGISPRGQHTVEIFGLNKHGRPEQREKLIGGLALYLGLWAGATNPSLKRNYETMLQVASDDEYSATIKAFLRGSKFPA